MNITTLVTAKSISLRHIFRGVPSLALTLALTEIRLFPNPAKISFGFNFAQINQNVTETDNNGIFCTLPISKNLP